MKCDGLDRVFNTEEFSTKKNSLELMNCTPSVNIVPLKQTDENEIILSDSEYIRQEMKNLIEKTKEALDEAIEEQASDAKARNSEVISVLAETTKNCLSELIHLNKIESELKLKQNNNKPLDPTSLNKVVNTNILIATTDEIIQRSLEKMQSMI